MMFALNSSSTASASSSSASNATDVSTARKKFEALIAKLETVATRDPQGYQRRVAALAALGYAYVFGVLLLCVALLALLVAIVVFSHHLNVAVVKIGFFVAVFTFVIIKSLFVSFPAPEGRPLAREEAPQLFAHVDEIGNRLKAPKPHYVLLTDDFNAAVAQVPRFGIFGGIRNYLIVGMQLMDTLSPEEFKAVLAHEFGHLSANHSKFSGRIYRVRQTWINLLENASGWVFTVFFNWYAPYFAAYSFVLARQNEYVADRCSAEICGARTTADALTRSEIAGSFLSEKVWPAIFARTGYDPQPPSDVYAILRDKVAAPLENAASQRWLTAAVCRPVESGDTHPSLSQRLAALKQEPRFEPRVGPSAAQFYLGARLEELSAQFDQQWSQAVSPIWIRRYEELSEARTKLEAIRSKDGELSDEEQWLLADATEDFGDAEGALVLFQKYLHAHPDEARAHFAVARLMLEQGEDRGLSHLERAVELERQATLPAAQLATNFLLQRNRSQEAEVWRERALSYEDMLEHAQAERRVTLNDTFLPHELPAEEVEKLRQHFAQFDAVQKVILVRKQLQHLAEVPFYVGGVAMKKKKFTISSDEEQRAKAFSQALENLDFEQSVVFIQLDADGSQQLRKKLEIVGDEGSLIYESAA